MKILSYLGVPYTKEMIAKAEDDIRIQAEKDSVDMDELRKRYPNAIAREFDGNPSVVTEADALIAYLQMLGTLVDFKAYQNKANLR